MTPTPTTTSPAPYRVLPLSRLLACFCKALLLLLPIAVAAYWSLADDASLAVRAANLPPAAIGAPLAPWQRVAGALLMALALLPLLIGLWHAQRCFAQFAAGQIFTRGAVKALQRFAGWTLVSVMTSMLSAAATSVLITLHNPPGLRHIAVGIGTDQVFSVFFAGMVWLMAAVIDQGQALADENAAFV